MFTWGDPTPTNDQEINSESGVEETGKGRKGEEPTKWGNKKETELAPRDKFYGSSGGAEK